MIFYLLGFFVLLTVLFFMSRALPKKLHLFFFLICKDKEQSIQLLTWLFLPGTVVHELSHLLVAELLRVPTGELSFTPEIRANNEIRAGGLKMAKTGPLRHALIGLAPIMVGITSIAGFTYFCLLPLLQKTLSIPFRPFYYQQLIINWLAIFIFSFLIFNLSNTMFSSKKDLETIVFPLLIIGLFGFAFWFAGIRISFAPKTIFFFTNILKYLDFALLGTVVIDFFFMLLVNFFLKKTYQNSSSLILFLLL
ncbi:MAG TPA: hypothetical protein VMW29_03270 [Candidatus Bathyarchaeia archaeon]|nr:hypothetical protein [Candidatus Bathyarchaeia archaeon]